eukprot:CAMPEP_0172525972 /NCGR_PEP_ID=MMETSP1067-20121228/983_1 /TAXON_ID=265564 ORGANISM="Thalassiosira punctigera, Strain Tpunct2005C2" /NCGR_SAMPLE_ID=MMETSP1067 /ASSEMBLY_ACC=CAM_ASM_000444 /LENGTH=617 /DNA_ID=CAMNT_0013309371 /DNA_START=125 /DNA_END=1978 /DNA_ORIENTATION=-
MVKKLSKRQKRELIRKQQRANPDLSATNNDVQDDESVNTDETTEHINNEFSVDLNQDHCHTCGHGGKLLCCDNCTLAFHLKCTRPMLDNFPTGKWFCPVCIANRSVATSRKAQQQARLDVEEIKKIQLSSKRAVEGDPISTQDNKKQKSAINEEVVDFVESYFNKNEDAQRACFEALIADKRMSKLISPSPISSQLHYNNQKYSLSDHNKYRPLDLKSFHWYPPNTLKGIHRSNHPPNQNERFNIDVVAKKACLNFANQISNFVTGLILTAEQRRLALWTSFSRPGMRDIMQSFGINTEQMNIGMYIASNVSKFLQRARATAHPKGRCVDVQRAAANAIVSGCSFTPEGKGEKEKDQSTHSTMKDSFGFTQRSLLHALGLSSGSHRLLRLGEQNRYNAKEGEEGSYDFLGQKKSWTKVPSEVIDRMRRMWIPNNKYMKDVPSMNETVIMRDVDNKIMRDENKKPIRVQIAVCRHRPRMVHNLMITPEEEGGFCEARDKDGNVLISETKLRQTWPQHIKFMTKRFKEMCACDKCGVSHDIQRSYNIKRMKIIKKLDRDVASMRDGRRKEEFHARIQKYKEEILVNGDLNVKRMSKAAEGVTCPCISINGLTLLSYKRW